MARTPLWLRLGFGAWVAAWIPSYWGHYGPSAFLWFCDLGNLQILAAQWTGSALLYSWAAVSVLLVQLAWILDAGGRLVAGVHVIGGTEYMWSPNIPPWIRAFSLFHVAAPPILLWGLARFGYDRRALPLQVLTAWIVLPASRLLTSPAENINWVYGPFGAVQTRLPGWAYVLACMAAYPLLLYVPTHLALRRLFRAPAAPPARAAAPPRL
jgi:hypothetical protein